ncbi:hypothetical protein EVD20_05580 [Elizabethkingia bruuniana]|nr:hypothetical protein [Elizabethkingia bruuniana]QDZ62383.1 hypothetical protein EVD20_05580 [Elizabethkingia bruuniana]
MLKDIRHIKGFFLLLLYVFANSPVILYHHHDDEIIAYSKASQCEKAIYYGDESNACNHKAHLTKAFKSVHCAIIIAYRLILSLMPLLFTLMYSLILNTAYVR